MLDQTCDVFVVETGIQSCFAVARCAHEHRARLDLTEVEPLFECMYRARLLR